MAMREYIGSRYIPKFMGLYDATTIYEALSVVDNGMGTSYITRKPTPAGTPMTDTEYWAIYGASSGAIINLQNQIDAMSAIIADLIAHKTDKYIFIGDSYAHSKLVGGVWQSRLDELVPDYMGLDASMYKAYGSDGSGFSSNGTDGTFEDMLDNTASDFPDGDVNKIVVMGGLNDHGTALATLETAVESFISKAATMYPDAQVIMVLCGYNKTTFLTRGQLHNMAGLYSQIKGLKYIDMRLSLKRNPAYMSNADHPSSLGYTTLAADIANRLKGGDGYSGLEIYTDNNAFIRQCTFNPVVAGLTLNVYESWYNAETIAVTFNGNVNITGQAANDYFKIGDLSDNICHGFNLNSTNAQQVSAVFRLANNDQFSCPVNLAIVNNEVRIRLNKSTGDPVWNDIVSVSLISTLYYPAWLV